MTGQPDAPYKSDDPIRRCDVLIRWVWATFLVIFFGWGFFVPLVLTVAAGGARIEAHRSHPHDDADHTYSTLIATLVNSAWYSTGVLVVLPAILLLVVIWLQLRRLRKRLAQG